MIPQDKKQLKGGMRKQHMPLIGKSYRLMAYVPSKFRG